MRKLFGWIESQRRRFPNGWLGTCSRLDRVFRQATDCAALFLASIVQDKDTTLWVLKCHGVVLYASRVVAPALADTEAYMEGLKGAFINVCFQNHN